MYIELPGYRQLFGIRLKMDRAKLKQLQRLDNVIREDPDALQIRVDTGLIYETHEMLPSLQEGAIIWPYGHALLPAHAEAKIYDVGWQLLGEGDLCMTYKPHITREEFSVSVMGLDDLFSALEKHEEAEKEVAKLEEMTREAARLEALRARGGSAAKSFEGPCRSCVWDEVRAWVATYETPERMLRMSGAVSRTADGTGNYQASVTLLWEVTT